MTTCAPPRALSTEPKTRAPSLPCSLRSDRRKRRRASAATAPRLTLDRYTLRQAIDDYIVSLEGKPAQHKAKQSLAAYVPADLSDKPLAEIGKSDLDAWLLSIVKLPPRTPGGLANVDMSDPEVKRRRKSSANRLMNNLELRSISLLRTSLSMLLPFILVGTINGALMSQQLWGSTYAIWPLFIVLFACSINSITLLSKQSLSQLVPLTS
jgi:hypothetical protein